MRPSTDCRPADSPPGAASGGVCWQTTGRFRASKASVGFVHEVCKPINNSDVQPEASFVVETAYAMALIQPEGHHTAAGRIPDYDGGENQKHSIHRCHGVET